MRRGRGEEGLSEEEHVMKGEMRERKEEGGSVR